MATCTLELVFSRSFVDDNVPSNYEVTVNDEDDDCGSISVFAYDVDEDAIDGLCDEDLCEFLGMDTDHLLYINR